MSPDSKILITGASGFIGRSLLWHAPRAFHWQMGRRRPEGEGWGNFIPADVRRYRFKKGRFDYIIHCTEAGPEATLNVVKSGAKILLISSGAAYYPGTPYADAKLESEEIVKKYGGVVCRLFSFMGPHLPTEGAFAAGNFIRDAITTGSIRINGDGSAVRSYMHTDDMANWVWTILEKGRPEAIYDVGGYEPITTIGLASEIARQATEKTRRSVEIEIGGGVSFSLAPKRYVPDQNESQEELGLRVTIGIKEAISKTIDWYIESLQ